MIEFPRESQKIFAETLGTSVKVLGIGGAGCNVVDRMAMEGMDSAELVTLNSDSRALMNGVTPDRLQLGAKLTRGLGAGGDPEIGKAAALESAEAIRNALENRRLVFLCVGLGGGTGSGAAPEVARIARECGAMVVAFVTLPFAFEGKRRVSQAHDALEQLRKFCDAVIVFENDRMGEVALATEGVQTAFEGADRLIGRSIRSVAAIITKPGMIRIGLDDLLAVLRLSAGHCLFGHGQGEGENRAKEALDRALRSPLLNRGKLLNQASAVLVHVTGGEDLRLFEVQTLMRELGKHVSEDAQIFFGMAVDPSLKKSLGVTVFSPLTDAEIPDESPTSHSARPDEAPSAVAPAAALNPPPLPTRAPAPAPEPVDSLFAGMDLALEASEENPTAVEPPLPAPEATPIDEPAVAATEPETETFAEPRHWEPEEVSAPVEPEVVYAEIPEAPAPELEGPAYREEPVVPDEPPAPQVFQQGEEPMLDGPAMVSPLTRRTVLPPPRITAKPEAEAGETELPGSTTRIRLGQALRPPARQLDEVAPADTSGQRELQLGARQDGGRFDQVEPVVVDGEDLDLPAYLRKRKKT